MSRDISWITEVTNNTDEDYVIWCWDTSNEGVYFDWVTRKKVGDNSDSTWVIVKAGAHLFVENCGIADGGEREGKPKGRVVARRKAIEHDVHTADPGVGLRLNRVLGEEGKDPEDAKDRLTYRDHGSANKLGEITFPRGMEQNLALIIDPDKIHLSVLEETQSTEWKAYLFSLDWKKKMTKDLEENLELLAKLAFETAAAMAL